MMKLSRCEDIINYLLLTDGKLVSDKSEGTPEFGGRTVNITRECGCNIKIGYLNMGDAQLVVEKMCSCDNKNWKNLDMVCLDK